MICGSCCSRSPISRLINGTSTKKKRSSSPNRTSTTTVMPNGRRTRFDSSQITIGSRITAINTAMINIRRTGQSLITTAASSTAKATLSSVANGIRTSEMATSLRHAQQPPGRAGVSLGNSVLLILQPEANPDLDLILGDFALFDAATHFGHLEPVEIAQ